jgi:hypothetical protein
VLPLQGDRTPRPYRATSFSEGQAQFSPDGKWVAYTSDESGQDEVYIQSFPDAHAKVRVSPHGGVSPRWAPAGNELYFLATDRRLMAVKFAHANPLQFGEPTRLFDTSVGPGPNRYAPARDGQHFLVSVATPESTAAPLVVMVNWAEQLAIAHRGRRPFSSWKWLTP